MPLPLPPVSSTASPAARAVRPSRTVGFLVAGAFALAILTTLFDRSAGPLALVLVIAALATAAVLAVRARWAATAPGALAPVAAPVARPVVWSDDAVADDTLAMQLRELHDFHIEQVNTAVAQGRMDLVADLSDSYAEEALALLTR
jgi:hypothetical protein